MFYTQFKNIDFQKCPLNKCNTIDLLNIRNQSQLTKENWDAMSEKY